MSSRYQCGTTPNEKIAEIIIGGTIAKGKLMFLMRWKGHECFELVSAEEVNSTSPEIVIKFYEERAIWNAEADSNEETIILNTEADSYEENRKNFFPQKDIKIDKSDLSENNRNGTGIKNTQLEVIENNVSKTTPIEKIAEKIIIGINAGGELVYLMKWVGIREHDFISAEEAKSMYPQMVIKFYEERLRWGI